MFETKHYLDKHFYLELDRKRRVSVDKLLFAETNGRCPKCHKPLEWNEDDDISAQDNQIAHIYGRRLFKLKNMPLDKPYHICKEADVDGYFNLIVLHKKCHKKYDENPTYEEYVEILDLKKNLYSKHKEDQILYYCFEQVIDIIGRGILNQIINNHQEPYTSFDKTEIEEKLEYNNINLVKRGRVLDNVRRYLPSLKQFALDYENIDEILNEYSEAYSYLKTKYSDKNKIVSIIDRCLIESCDEIFEDSVPIITDYMIMNCEVLDNVPK